MREFALAAGLTSTTVFVLSYLPMLYRALRTRDQSVAAPGSDDRLSYLAASALMLDLHLRHIDPDPGVPLSPRRLSCRLQPRAKPIDEGGRE